MEELSEAVNASAASTRKVALDGSIDQGEDDGGAKSHARQGNMNPGRDDQLSPGNLQKVGVGVLERMVERRSSVDSLTIDISNVHRVGCVALQYFRWDQADQGGAANGVDLKHLASWLWGQKPDVWIPGES